MWSGRTAVPHEIFEDIADYASGELTSAAALETARYCLMDSLACGLRALSDQACAKLLGPVVPGATMPGGARVPGTSFELEPIHAARSIAAMMRWQGSNDSWIAAEWRHPSDSLGAILAVADYLSRGRASEGKTPLRLREVLSATIKASEIQRAIAPTGLVSALLVRVASTAVAASLLGASREQISIALSNAWSGGAAGTDTGSPESRVAGDAAACAVTLALVCMSGKTGRSEVPCDVLQFRSPRAYGSPLMDSALCAETIQLLKKKFATSILGQLTPAQCYALRTVFADQDALEQMSVNAFMALLVKN